MVSAKKMFVLFGSDVIFRFSVVASQWGICNDDGLLQTWGKLHWNVIN